MYMSDETQEPDHNIQPQPQPQPQLEPQQPVVNVNTTVQTDTGRLLNILVTLLACGGITVIGYQLALNGLMELAASGISIFTVTLVQSCFKAGILKMPEVQKRMTTSPSPSPRSGGSMTRSNGPSPTARCSNWSCGQRFTPPVSCCSARAWRLCSACSTRCGWPSAWACWPVPWSWGRTRSFRGLGRP